MRTAVLLGLAGSLLLLRSATALEKRMVLDDVESPSDEWVNGNLCTIYYYNRCTLWSWAWSGFEPGERIGVHYATTWCTDYGSMQTVHRVFTGSPAGYGYTGTLAIVPATMEGCPGSVVLHSQPFLATAPFTVINWSTSVWLGPPGWFLLWTNGNSPGNPVSFGSDHPAAGPTGPVACGLCYPVDRPIHSFRFGTVASPLCPGAYFDDGTCPAELRWDLFGNERDISGPVSVESESWGGIKAMYR